MELLELKILEKFRDSSELWRVSYRIDFLSFIIISTMKIILYYTQLITMKLKEIFFELYSSRVCEAHDVTHAIIIFGKFNRDISRSTNKNSKQSRSSSNATVVYMFHIKRSIFDRSIGDELRKMTGTERSVSRVWYLWTFNFRNCHHAAIISSLPRFSGVKISAKERKPMYIC